MPEAQVIACPTCAKKFKLPEVPPPTFTCTGCQTVMDLSAFRTAVPAAEAAAPTGASVAGAGTSRRAGARTAGSGSTRTAGARARVGARSRRGVDEGDEEDGQRGLQPEKKSMALVWVSLVGLVVVVGVGILAMSGGGGDKGDAKEEAKAGDTPTGDGTTPATPAGPAMPPPPAPGTPGTAPAPDAPTAPATPFVALGKVQIHAIEHHPDATDDEKKKIDDLINVSVFENAGADSRIAGTALVALGVKAAPRLINVFYTVKTGEGYGNREGNAKAQIADALLRRIDGHIERRGSPRFTPIRFSSDEKHVTSIVKRWIYWWENKLYTDPRKPWDDRVDGNRDDAPDKPADDAARKAPDAPPDGK